MELSRLYQELRGNYKEGQLRISSSQYENTFWSVMRQLYEEEVILTLCTLNYYDTYIEINGKTMIGLLYQGKQLDIQILCYQRNDKIWCQLKLSIANNCQIQNLFSVISGSMVAKEGVYAYSKSILAEVVMKYPELITDSDQVYAQYPFSIKAGISFPMDTWKAYAILTVGLLTVNGKVALKDEWSMNGNVKFQLEVPLISNISFDFLKNATLVLKLYAGKQNPYDTNFMERTSGADLSLEVEMENVSTPMEFSTSLFDSDDVWQLEAGFEKGFGLSDGVNMLLRLLRVNNLYLPPNTPLDFLKLYDISTRLALKDGKIDHMDGMRIILASSEPWVLPIPSIRLQDFLMTFEVTYGNKSDSILTGEVSGTVCLNLGDTMLSLSAKAFIPSMDFMGSLIWEDSDWDKPVETVTLTNLLSPFQAKAPSQDAGSTFLARLDVYASMEQRQFSVSADIKDVFQFTIGNFQINLAEILVEAELSSSTRNASIAGTMGFGDKGTENYFELYAKAAYLTGDWSFEGGLKLGIVNIGKVLTQIFKIDQSQILEDLLNIEMRELQLSFDSKGKQYSILAAFHASWEIFKRPFVVDGRVQLRRVSDQTDLYASAMFAVSIGLFQVVVQADDFYSTKRNYLFRIQYDKLFLQAIYAVDNNKDILTISMGGMTLGGLVETFVNMWNPNAHFQLSAPWNLINKIDLSKFQLVINVTDETAAFYYLINLNILGLMEIEKVGIQYRPDKVTKVKKIFFALTGKLLDQSYSQEDPLTWDAVDGKPPAASALNQKTFTLYYLGVGQHVKNDDAKKAQSLQDALIALKKQLDPSKQVEYDPEMNWLFGADFKMGALRIGVVLNDPVMYGLMITIEENGGALAAFSGLYLELLYRKITQDISMFKATLMLPDKFRTLQLGIVTLKIGLVSFEVYTNGNFYIDMGFPHNADFSNSFVLEVYIFTGRGGVYFGVLTGATSKSVPQVTNGAFSTVILLGVGLSFGLGRSFDLGIAKGGLSLEVFGIFEGVLGFFECMDDKKQYLYYSASATVGIYGRLFLSVDFKVITICASVEIKAYAKLTLEAYKAMLIALDLSLKLKASVKILFAKINFSYSFNKHVEFRLGDDSMPPWKLAQTSKSNQLRSRDRLIFANQVPLFLGNHLKEGEVKTILINLLPFFSVSNPVINMVNPSQSNEETSYCVAFLPILDEDNQKQLISLLSEWLLSHWIGDRIILDPNFTPDKADQLTYEELFSFLQNNVLFQLDLTDKSEMEGAAFPMLPPITLGWNATGTLDVDKVLIHYWQESLVSADYANMLTEYFKKLNPDPSYRPMLGSVEEGEDIPLAQLIFLDYFQMALRELIGQIVGFFEEFTCTLGDKQYSVEDWEKNIRNNPKLAFTPGTLLFPQYAYSVRQGDSLDTICTRMGITYETLLAGCGKQTMILRQSADIMLSEYQFDNVTRQLPVKLAAALFYVRYEEFVLEDQYQDYSAKIRNLNPQFPISEEITELGSAPIILPIGNTGNGMLWSPLIGDTLLRLGKMCAFYDMDPGEHIKWDQFLSSVQERNGIIQIPPWKTLVDGDLMIEMLLHRLFPDQNETAWTKSLISCIFVSDILVIFTKISLVNIPYQVQQKEGAIGETAEEILTNSGATINELAAGVAFDCRRIDQSQSILLTNQEELVKEDVLKQLVQIDANGLTTMLSRFLLQGLRIPNPWPEEENGKYSLRDYVDSIKTLPLFETMKQQLSYVQDSNSWELTCQGSQEGCNWVDTSLKSRTFTNQQIQVELPATQITLPISGPIKMSDFLETMPCYPISSQMPWNIASEVNSYMINILPANLCSNLEQIKSEPEGRNGKGDRVTSRWGTYLPIQIRKGENGSNRYPIYGANAQDRLLLREVLNSQLESIHLLYKPSPVAGISECLAEDSWNQQKSTLVKMNLSVETHMRPVKGIRGRALQMGPDYQYSANLEPEHNNTFLRLLWECSVVGGGGYYLILEKEAGDYLPDNLFDEEGNGYLYILILYSGYPQNRKPVNCTATLSSKTQGEALTYYEQFDEARKDYQVAFPVGCVGVSLETQVPPEIITSPEDRTKQIFHIVGYQIQENAEYEESHESVPLVPQSGSTEALWGYTPVLPLYRFLTGDEKGIYGANGKTASINFEIRDILGNKAQINGFSVSLTPNYNDFLLAIHEWPYQSVYYEVIGDGQSPMLRITCEPSLDLEIKDSLTNQLVSAYLQLMQEDVFVKVNSCFFEKDTKDLDISGLRSYLAHLLQYVKGQGEKPNKLSMDFSLKSQGEQEVQLPSKVFPLYTKITISRNGFQTQAKRAQMVESNIPPWKEDTDKFVNNLETALPGVRIAQGDGSNNSLYGILFGEKGAVKSIKITPFTYTDPSGQQVDAPEFYALSPLMNQWMSRNCRVADLLPDGTLSSQEEEKIYSNIDMEVWAIRFLEDVEQMLLLATKWIWDENCKNTYDAFVEGKRQLAEIITEQLVPLRQGANCDETELKKQMKDKLLRSLSDGYQIGLAALYQMEVITNQECRMTVTGQTQDTDAIIQPGKIIVNNSAQSYGMFINATSDWKAGLTPIVHASIQEIEYDMEDVEGNYQSSKWLRLFHPIKQGDLENINLSLSSGIPFPNLLKRCPLSPTIQFHQCENGNKKMIQDMLQWDYSLNCKYQPFEQDTLFLNVEFGCRSKNMLRATSKDLFDMLAQYDAIRDSLITKLRGEDQQIFNKSFDTFLQILNTIQGAWKNWIGIGMTRLKKQLEERVYECKITMEKQEGKPVFTIIPLNGTQKVLKDMGAEDPRVEYISMTDSELVMQFSIDNLPLYDCHTATPFIKIVRNGDLLKQWQVNEVFIYRTAIVSKEQVKAAYINYDEIVIGKAPLTKLSDYQTMIQNLWASLELNGVGLTMDMNVSYIYSLIKGMDRPAVRLPVTLYLGILADGSLTNTIGENLYNWYSSVEADTNQAYYLFDITVYADDDRRVLLHLPQLLYYVQI